MPARFQVKITRSAGHDIEDIWTFIASDDEDAATKFVGELERQAARLARFPERCALIPENELLGARLLDTSMFEIDR